MRLMPKRPAMLMIIIFMFSGTLLAQQQKPKKTDLLSEGVPILWTDPVDLESRDLFLGLGGEVMKPDLSKVTFIEDKPGGYSTKFVVSDGAGRKWVTKLREEVRPETSATRLLWAVGYNVEVTYFFPRVTIEGKGTFDNMRFEARPKELKRLGEWKWTNNPFVGTREFQGLKVMMALINNWDLKDSNNVILGSKNKQTGKTDLLYAISDLGATFGKTGGVFSHTRNRPEDFGKSKFITGVKKGIVEFDFHGKGSGLMKDIKVENAKWIGSLLARLSDQQLRDAFRAGGFNAEEIDILAGTLHSRISELINLK
jgi:hypothetical protein